MTLVRRNAPAITAEHSRGSDTALPPHLTAYDVLIEFAYRQAARVASRNFSTRCGIVERA